MFHGAGTLKVTGSNRRLTLAGPAMQPKTAVTNTAPLASYRKKAQTGVSNVQLEQQDGGLCRLRSDKPLCRRAN